MKPSRNAPTKEIVVQRVSVSFEYPVVFTSDSLAPDNRALLDVLRRDAPERRPRVFAVLDAGFAEAWPEIPELLSAYFAAHSEHLELVAEPVRVPGGEAAKNEAAIVERLHEHFYRRHLDRHAFVLILGGGAVLDAVGYATATAHRGLRALRMPTTVLSQNDSGVGVKNGVNAFGAKNFLGTFTPPFGVVSDARFLERLPARDAVAGLAEAVKVALIRDADFFAWLEANAEALAARRPVELNRAIRRCAELHLRHIATSGDAFEHGSARPLDFGHWAAHKLESLTSHEVRHGEAVAIGMLLDSRYSFERGFLPLAAFERIQRLLRALTLPSWHPKLGARGVSGRHALLEGLEEFREHLGGELTVTLLRDIGAGFEAHAMDAATILRCLNWLETHITSYTPWKTTES